MTKFQRGLKELLRALNTVRPGDMIIVLGQEYSIVEVVEYKLGDFEWRNLVSRDQATGNEIAFEVAEGKIRRWDKIDLPGITPQAEILEYEGEEYEKDESGKARAIFYTLEGTEKGRVSYSVLNANSGNRLSVEEVDGKVTVYFSKDIIPPYAIQVP